METPDNEMSLVLGRDRVGGCKIPSGHSDSEELKMDGLFVYGIFHLIF